MSMSIMTAFKGAGTCSSPYTLSSSDDDDSENEVIQAICPRRSRSISMSPSPQLRASRPLDSGLTDSAESVHIDEKYASHSSETARQETGTKRKRSESVVSMDCQSDESADGDGEGEGDGPPATIVSNLPVPGPGKSRKAKKRRIKAAAKKELYLDRLRRLTHNPALVPHYPSGFNPAAANNMSPFAFLPQFHSQLLNPPPPLLNIPPPQPPRPSQDYHYPGDPAMGQNLWSMGGNLFPGQPQPIFEQSAWTVHPPVPDIPPHPPVMAPAMGLDPSPTSAQAELYAISPKFSMKSPDIIGVKPEDDPDGKHGLFRIPETHLDKDMKPYVPDPACTLVLEQLPKLHRTQDWIATWSLSVSQVHPVEIIIDHVGKALIEFPSADAAHRAWSSPRLGAANLGLKQHLLKGRPRDDLIRAHWYRVGGISAGVGEIEEGEIEEAGCKANVAQRGKKKEKKLKPRPEKQQKREEDPRAHNARPPTVPHNLGFGTFVPNNGLPPRPPLPPPPASRSVYPPVSSVSLSASVPTNGDVSYRPTHANDGDDMDISPPPTALISSNVMDSKIPLGPRAMYPRKELQNYPKLDVAPQGAASLPSPPNTTPSSAGPDSTALEADLRKRVQESKRVAGTLAPLPQPQPLSTPPIPDLGVHPGGASPAMSLDVDSFLAGVPRPSPLSQIKVALSAREEELAREKAALFAREEALARELASLREKKRLRQTEQKRPSPALTGPGSSSELIKPSPKLNLDHVPELVRTRPFWFSQSEQTTVVILSDGEDDEEGSEDDGEEA